MQPDSSHPESHILPNLLHFGRLLRRMGIPISSFQVIELVQALRLVDFSEREDVYHTCRAILVHDPSQFEKFDRVFRLIWQHHQEWLVEFGEVAGSFRVIDGETGTLASENVLLPSPQPRFPEDNLAGSENAEAASVSVTYSAEELLREVDFAFLNADQVLAARQAIQELVFRFERRRTRRQVRALKRGSTVDFPRVFRKNLKAGGEIIEFSWSTRKLKPRPVIILCDISGSMERYSQLFLQFMFALVQDRRSIETFVFGTRLSYITPALKYRDIDQTVKQLSREVLDWSGGTRIGEALKEFNYKWSRRMLRRGAVVILISDGWDRGDVHLLEREIARLRRSSYRLLWLNPLAGRPGYEPLVKGMQTVLPYIDEFLPLNNLRSFETLADRLGNIESKRSFR